MNKKPANIPSGTMPFPPGFEVCWAGANPFGSGCFFGSEDGGVQLFDNNFRPLGSAIKTSPSGEAINSVAGVGTWFATSTRRDINFIGRSSQAGKSEMYHAPYGAHDLAVTTSGFFVAALGRLGLLFAEADIRKDNFTITNPGAEGELSVYSVLTLPGDAQHDLVVCAGRTGGILYCQWRASQATTNMRTMSFADLDVVDVCSIGTIEHPRAVAALAKNGALLLSKDILADEKPGTVKFDNVTGTAYRVVRCRGHLFVLTRNGVFGLWNLAENFVNGTFGINGDTSILGMPMEATDLNVVMDHWLLIVGLDSIEQIDVDGIQEGEERTRPQILRPDWKSNGVTQTPKEFALTA
jgi:hypothetical protein